MNHFAKIFGLLIFLLSGCNTLDRGEGDLLYKIYEDKAGPGIEVGDFVGLVAVEKTESDSVTYTSHDYDRPSYMYLGNPIFKGDLLGGLKLLSLGDSALLKINLDSMVNHGRQRPVNHIGKYLVYNIRVTDVLKRGSLTDSAFTEKVNAFVRKKQTEWMKAQPYKIRDFIKKSNMKLQITPGGLYYHVSKMGEGISPSKGDTVELNYRISLMSGKLLDSTYPADGKMQIDDDFQKPDGPLRWYAGLGRRFYTPGFNQAMLMFPKGTKAKLIIPSHLAYGAEGGKGIPPFIPLIVDLEILEIIPKKGEITTLNSHL